MDEGLANYMAASAFRLKPEEFDEQFDKYMRTASSRSATRSPADYGRNLAPKRDKTPYVAESPAISPDGREVAFAGRRGGVSDLFAVNIESGEVRNLTTDEFGDYAPTYAPDGRTLIYVRLGPLQSIEGFKLVDGRASYGIGLETFALGFPVHFDWSWRTLFNREWEDAVFAYQGGSTWFRKPRFAMWIGYDF